MSAILILDGHGRQVLSCVRAMGRNNHHITVASHKKDALCFYSRYTHNRLILPDPGEKPDLFIKELLHHLRQTAYDLLLPFSDSTHAAIIESQEKIKQLTNILVPDSNSFKTTIDKAETLKLAQKLNIPHPVSWFPATSAEAEIIARDIPYPVVIKPRRSSGSRGLKIVHTFHDFKLWFEKINMTYPNPIIQEFIPSQDSVGLVALYGKDCCLKAYSQHKRLHEYPLTGGPSTLRETIRDDRLTDLGTKLLNALSWQGPAMVEFRIDARDNLPKLMEINPRLPGSTPLHIAAGVNFPELILQEVLNKNYAPVFNYTLGMKAKWLLPGEILFFLANLRQGRFRLEALKWWEKDQVLDIISKDDPLPALAMIRTIFKSALSIKGLKQAIFR